MKKINVAKEFRCWTVGSEDQYTLDAIDAQGSTLEELIDNCEVYLSTQHGNQGPDWSLDDLDRVTYNEVVEILTSEFNAKIGVVA